MPETSLDALEWATRLAVDVADRRMREQGRTEWNAGDRLLADLVLDMLTRRADRLPS